jgi:ribose-phosphate pyrophosphokinase
VTDTVLVALPGNEALAERLTAVLPADLTVLETRLFPDGETYLRYRGSVAGKSAVLLCSLDRPDSKFLALSFAAAAARELGAVRVGLAAPYLSYMRQDRRFKDGEAVTSKYFARLLSSQIDWLVTVDPHLHRFASLSEIYSVPTRIAHAAAPIARWIEREVPSPLILGPDGESEQWVADVAEKIGAPFAVMTKIRRGDHDVRITLPDLTKWNGRTPVLVDDIASSARTMIDGVKLLRQVKLHPAVCVTVHGIFAGDSYDALRSAGASKIVTVNTVPHESNAIDVAPELAAQIRALAA